MKTRFKRQATWCGDRNLCSQSPNERNFSLSNCNTIANTMMTTSGIFRGVWPWPVFGQAKSAMAMGRGESLVARGDWWDVGWPLCEILNMPYVAVNIFSRAIWIHNTKEKSWNVTTSSNLKIQKLMPKIDYPSWCSKEALNLFDLHSVSNFIFRQMKVEASKSAMTVANRTWTNTRVWFECVLS